MVVLTMTSSGMFAFLAIILFIQFSSHNAQEAVYNSPWHYRCKAGSCQKESIENLNGSVPLSLSVCQLFCGQYGPLWPKPTGHLSLGSKVIQLNPENIILSGIDPNSKAGYYLQKNIDLLKQNLRNLAEDSTQPGGVGLMVHIEKSFESDDVQLTLDTKENYVLQVSEYEPNKIAAVISAPSYFGARHALETLSQLIVYDDLNNMIQMIRDAYIVDGPVYPYRGILLDTSRNFVDKATILRTIEAMSMSKLNTFHWHITDSHSFPYVSRTWPQMSVYGAYSSKKVYKKEDIQEILEFGLIHGVRVLPEFDAPAHVGEGWQWVGHNATVCFKAEPWRKYCVEPPCGQLNPTSEKVYEILHGLYQDMLMDFRPDIFHMGGDEVNLNCWRSSEQITNWMSSQGWNQSDSSYYLLWYYFQSKAYEKLTLANGNKEMSAILWTSGLTDENNLKYLDPSKYIIQIWTTGSDATIGRLLKNKFRVILSNYDALYFDCGYGAWIGEGNNWCSPYKGWQLVYGNSPKQIALAQGFSSATNLILGAEATLWSEQVDSTAVDSKLWPRAAAMAERLWAEPDYLWNHAEQRILRHRERLVQRGINSDSLEPEWCLQNQGYCY